MSERVRASGYGKRDGKSHLVIDFRFRDKDGREQRYRRDAHVQTRAGAEAEARRLMEIAHATGTLELRAEAPTLRAFVEDAFKPLYRTKFRPGTWRRYEGLLRQGLLDELGDKRVDAIGATVVRAFMATVAKRGIQARGPVNLLRTLLTAAVETGALQEMPELSKPTAAGRKLPSAPSTEEVEAMLGKAEGWLRIAIALAAFAGLRQGEVRALEVRDVDLKAGVINVRRALSENAPVAPKSGHERVVPLFPRLAEALGDGIRGKLPAARVVLNQSGRTPSRQAVWTELHALLIRHQLPERSYHALRHYFVTALVRGGQPGSGARAGRPLQAPHHATLRARHRRGSSRRDRAASG